MGDRSAEGREPKDVASVRPASMQEVEKAREEGKTIEVTWEGFKDGDPAERSMMADICEKVGLHDEAAMLREDSVKARKKPGFGASIKRAWNAPIRTSTLTFIFVGAGIGYLLYSGVAYYFHLPGGIFGKKAMADEVPARRLRAVS